MMYGSNIQSPNDRLLPLYERDLYRALIKPKPQIERTIEQLRIIYSLDEKKYALLKRTLPYVVCGSFNPAFRLMDNFAYADSFILDFDHLSQKGLSIDVVRCEINSDARVVMCFSSPGEDGLKVLFHLKDRCYDKGLYSIFYKSFASKFAHEHHLEQVIDAKTSDVTRACFISIDSGAYYNPDAEAVDLSSYVDVSDPISVFDLKRSQDLERKSQAADIETKINASADPEKDVMEQIKQRLNPRVKVPSREVFVPAELNELIGGLREYIEGQGISIAMIENIQYGKKIHARLGCRQAEVNLFFGKRGFSVVISSKRGTDAELNELLKDVVSSYLVSR